MYDISNYIMETFGVPIHLVPVSKEIENLPFYLGSTFNFWKGTLFQKPVIFIENIEKELLPPDQLKKQIDNIRNIVGTPVILVLGRVESYKRNRIIQQGINFIMVNKQMYLPDFLVDLKDYLKPETKQKGNLIPPAQHLLLYHLQKESLDHTTYRQLTQKMPLVYLSVSRAVENLCRFGLCRTEGAKEKILHFEADRSGLWEKALPFFFNPVKKTIFVNQDIPRKEFKVSGINALAHYTNISGSPTDQYAVSEREFHKMHRQGLISLYSEHDGRYEVQLWKYNPIVDKNEEFIDRLSLYLIFRKEQNERVQIELENMLKKVFW